MPPRKKPKTDAAPDVEPLKPVEMTAAELRRALELKGIKPKSATARPALVRMLQEATTDDRRRSAPVRGAGRCIRPYRGAAEGDGDHRRPGRRQGPRQGPRQGQGQGQGRGRDGR